MFNRMNIMWQCNFSVLKRSFGSDYFAHTIDMSLTALTF